MKPRHAIEWVKLFLQRNELLYHTVMHIKVRRLNSVLVRKSQTRVVIEAFPRSANSFCVRLFRHANPGVPADTIAHHSHAIANVKRAVRWGIPVIVVIRDPIEAISSNMVARDDFSDEQLRILATKYVDFYGWIATNRDRVAIAEFSEITGGHFREVSSRINRHFSTDFNVAFDEGVLAEAVRNEITTASPNRDIEAMIPIPSELRDAKYDELRPYIRSHAAAAEPQKLYAELSNQIVTNGERAR